MKRTTLSQAKPSPKWRLRSDRSPHLRNSETVRHWRESATDVRRGQALLGDRQRAEAPDGAAAAKPAVPVAERVAMTAPALLTEAEAAEQIGVKPRTLRALRSQGKIRYVRPSPRKIFYKIEDVAEYLERHTCQDEPPCPHTNPRKAASTNSTSGSKVIGITARRAALRNGTRTDSKPTSDGR